MAKNLFIVESPNKCHKLKSYLGADYNVMASVGHIRSIPRKGTNIDIKNNFEPIYEISKDKKDVVKKIKEAAKKSETIYLATDFDREGEAIAQSIYDVIDKASQKKCKRITFVEITKKAVLYAIKHPRDIDKNQVDAQKARQVLDRLIGYKISPLLWYSAHINHSSAGRVQSVALKIVCDRQREIDAFKPENYWFIEALLKGEKDEFWAKVVTKDKDNKYKNEKIAISDLEKLKKSSYHVSNIEKTSKKNNPYPPFDTNSLQATCSSLFKWSLKQSQSVAQKLYEAGKCTYIRSDSFNISKDALDDVRKFIENSESSEYLPSKANVYSKKSSASSQEAHECIRPTDINDEGDDISDFNEKKMYDLIRARFIACQMTPQIANIVTCKIKSSSGHELIAKGQTVKFKGWTKAYKYVKSKELMLPELKNNEKLDLETIKKTKHETQPPNRYNEGGLAKAMEKEGVGRPSTRASIITEVQKKNYLEKDNKTKALIATPLGLQICDWLNPKFKDFFMDIKYTAKVEEDLNEIADGKKIFIDVMNDFYKNLQDHIKEFGQKNTERNENMTGAKCLKCEEGDIVEKNGKYGIFYTCNKYPQCKTIFEKDENGEFKIKGKKELITGKKCPECKENGRDGRLIERINKKDGNSFWGCSEYPKCKYSEAKEDNKTIPPKKENKKNNNVVKDSENLDDLDDLEDLEDLDIGF